MPNIAVEPGRRIRAVIPLKTRQRYFDQWCRVVLWATTRRLAALNPGEMPSHDTLAALRKGWNNNPWTAHIGLMEATARHVIAGKGPILECGSGATTVLLAALAKANGREVWTLEEQEHWADKLGERVRRFSSARVLYRPIVDYGPFEWYDMPDGLPDRFSLVVCDGPRSWIKGGRGGVYEMMSHRFTDSCVILMDDAQRQKERDHMRDWRERFGADYDIVRAEGRPYGLVRVGKRVEPLRPVLTPST